MTSQQKLGEVEHFSYATSEWVELRMATQKAELIEKCDLGINHETGWKFLD